MTARPEPPAEAAARGWVFDIQRAALHDGPGIRTTVFLKGCPLRCQWCHNPESWHAAPELSFEAGRCTDCLECVEACPNGAHRVHEGRHRLDRKLCRACGRCVEVCDPGALALVGRETTVEEVMAVVERDRAFYARSGGGLTVSGGEPLAQASFTRALLAAARNAGIHTCLDTCGAGSPADLDTVLPVTDVVLFDYKATGAETHQVLTGVDGVALHESLERVLASGTPVILRVPLVPGVNDTDAHLDAVADLASRHTLAGVEIMPFHAHGRDKSRRLGRPETPDRPSATARQSRGWVQALASRGCEARLG